MKASHKFIVKTIALVALAIVGLEPRPATAEELPDSGGCIGEVLQVTQANHCCSYNTCYVFFDVYATATVTFYPNQCVVVAHTGTDGCCFF